MSRLSDQLGAMTFPHIDLDAGEILTDVVVCARVTRMVDGRSTVLIAASDGVDNVVRVGLMECARQIEYDREWEIPDDD